MPLVSATPLLHMELGEFMLQIYKGICKSVFITDCLWKCEVEEISVWTSKMKWIHVMEHREVEKHGATWIYIKNMVCSGTKTKKRMRL